MTLEDPLALSPIHFFSLETQVRRVVHAKPLGKKHSLPDTSPLADEGDFVRAYAGWCPEGLHFLFHMDVAIKKSFFPQMSRGDALELFVDTRDRKDTAVNTRFCHHFYFLPQELEGQDRGEITRFRGSDAHKPCEPADLELSVKRSSANYEMKIFIPSSCLHGYDGAIFPRLGFTYRVHRYGGRSQGFSTRGEEFQIEQQPWLWATLRLEE